MSPHEGYLAEEIFVDDGRGGVVQAESVKQARREEVQWSRGMGVREPVFREDMDAEGAKTVSPRCVGIDQGDLDRPSYRSRLVLREIKKAVKKADVNLAAYFLAFLSLFVSHTVRKRRMASELLRCATSAVRTMEYQCSLHLWSSLTRRNEGSHV